MNSRYLRKIVDSSKSSAYFSTVSTYSVKILDTPVCMLSFDQQMAHIIEWAKERSSRVVCVANVHMLTEACTNLDLKNVLNSADLVTPDGMPLVWMISLLRWVKQDRVAGMDIFVSLCKQCEQEDVSVFLLGSEASTLQKMLLRMKREFPHLKIAGAESLPFRSLTTTEDALIIQKVNQSGAGITFLSLGCPKQEIWAAQHKNRIAGTIIGLGGIFPIYAGLKKYAPRWVRDYGMEWAYRLIQEPRRLWKRYAVTIPIFAMLALKQLLEKRFKPSKSDIQQVAQSYID